MKKVDVKEKLALLAIKQNYSEKVGKMHFYSTFPPRFELERLQNKKRQGFNFHRNKRIGFIIVLFFIRICFPYPSSEMQSEYVAPT